MITCKDCDKRHLGCHDKCEAYQQYKDERRIIAENRQKEKVVRTYSAARKKDMIDTYRKNF